MDYVRFFCIRRLIENYRFRGGENPQPTTPWKSNSSPLKMGRDPISEAGSSSFAIIFQGRTVKLQGYPLIVVLWAFLNTTAKFTLIPRGTLILQRNLCISRVHKKMGPLQNPQCLPLTKTRPTNWHKITSVRRNCQCLKRPNCFARFDASMGVAEC